MRYLSESDLFSTLSSGGTVEQFLPPRVESEYRALRWISITRGDTDLFSVSRYEVFDEGDLNHLDLYSFSFVDPDEPSVEYPDLPSAESALLIAERKFGADRRKYVSIGIIQDEYADYLKGTMAHTRT
jgi:hypothetical protein